MLVAPGGGGASRADVEEEEEEEEEDTALLDPLAPLFPRGLDLPPALAL